MSDYTKSTNFSAKDALPSGDSGKIVKGTEHDTEYDAIQTAVATKADKVSGMTANNLFKAGTGGNLADAGFLVTAFPVANIDITGATATTTTHADDELAIYSGDATANRAMLRTDLFDGFVAAKGMHNLLHVQGSFGAGVGGGGLTASTYTTCTLNITLTAEVGSRSGNTITLPAGTYYLEAYTTGYKIDSYTAEFYNSSDASIVFRSAGGHAAAAGDVQTQVALTGRFTIAGSKTFYIRIYSSATNATDGRGKNAGYAKILTDVRVWQIGG